MSLRRAQARLSSRWRSQRLYRRTGRFRQGGAPMSGGSCPCIRVRPCRPRRLGTVARRRRRRRARGRGYKRGRGRGARHRIMGGDRSRTVTTAIVPAVPLLPFPRTDQALRRLQMTKLFFGVYRLFRSHVPPKIPTQRASRVATCATQTFTAMRCYSLLSTGNSKKSVHRKRKLRYNHPRGLESPWAQTTKGEMKYRGRVVLVDRTQRADGERTNAMARYR